MKRESKLLEAKAIVSLHSRSIRVQVERLNLSAEDKAVIFGELAILELTAKILDAKLARMTERVSK